MEKQIYLSEGRKINSSKDIISFMEYMGEKYGVKMENGIIETIVKAYTSDPNGKDHIVGFNQGNEWFMNFLSNDEVIVRQEIEEGDVVMDNSVYRKKPRSGGSNITKPKKKRKK